MIADFRQFYGIDVVRALRERETPAREVAGLLLALPRGSRVSRAVGGAWAWTDEVVAALAHSHMIRTMWWAYNGRKGTPPAPPEPPKGWLVERTEAEQKAAAWKRRAEAWKRDNAAAIEAQRAAGG